ncbi:sigma-70 family RNA polymerase sigma factor [Chengkuizengella axinellae]|uniref:sigma-70 family RNA polymerase sigma factor n=1 Tax=Chengkuizengella axinellae TaxID=3064388 RepID=UPI00352769C1
MSKRLNAFDKIYTNYVNDVFKYLMILTKNSDLAEELTQETFYKAYKNIDHFQGKSKMSVWLCQIAKNNYYSYLKKEKRINHSDAMNK